MTREKLAAKHWFLRCIGPVILVLASLTVGLVHVPQHTGLSVVDEYVYVDYLSKVPTEFVVHQGEETDTYARKSLACRGVWHAPPNPASMCTPKAYSNDALFPYDGKTSADIYTPLYFGVTWLLAQPIKWLGVNDLTNAGRFAGAIWLAAAALVLYLALRRLKIRRSVSVGAGLMIVGSLAAYWANTFVSTDATALLAGAIMLYLIARTRDDPRFSWLFVVLAVVLTLFKLQNFAAVAVAVLYLLIFAARHAYQLKGGFWHGFRRWLADGRVRTAIVASVASVLAQIGWLAYRALTTVASTEYQGDRAALHVKDLINELFRFFGSTGVGAAAPAEMGRIGVIIGAVISVVTVVGVIALIVASKPWSRSWTLAVSVAVVALLIGPALATMTYFSTGVYFLMPTRYGTALFPFMVACAALLIRKKPIYNWPFIVIAVGLYGSGLAVTG